MQVFFEHKQAETDDINTYFFRPEKPLSFVAGQYIELTLPMDNPDPQSNRRWFTIASAPHEPLLAITTRINTGAAYKLALETLLPGDPAHMSEAMGDFVLPKDTTRPLVFVAGGLGVTPFVSMFRDMIYRHENRPITFFHAVPNESSIIFQDVFAAAKIHATIVVKKPSPAWSGERGRIEAMTILGVSQPDQDSLIYIAGPNSFVERLRHDLVTQGVPRDQTLGDYFSGYPKEAI